MIELHSLNQWFITSVATHIRVVKGQKKFNTEKHTQI